MNTQTRGFLALLEERLPTLTPTGKRIATYLLANPDHLPFATANSVGEQTGTSGVSVGRFLRTLGYRNFDEVRSSLRSDWGPTWRMTDRLEAYREKRDNSDFTNQSLVLEQEAIAYAYALSQTPTFHKIIDHLAQAEAVFVVGLQLTRGIVSAFCNHLEFIRPKVYFVDGLSGTFAESLNSGFERPYILFADMRAYSTATQKYCKTAADRGLSMALITDTHCTWARDYPVDLLQIKTNVGQFWDSMAPLTCLFNLMASAVVELYSDELEKRLNDNKELQLIFGQFEL